MMKWEAEKKGYTCNDCYLSMQNCHDKSICCEDETGLCDFFEELADLKENKMDNGLISRQQAIDALDCINGVEEVLRSLPSAQPEWKWIPCSERLPEEDTEVLISYRYKEGEGDTDHVNIDITSYGTTCFGGREIHTLKEWRQPFDYFHANYEVVAWMPLLEPYGGEQNEAN